MAKLQIKSEKLTPFGGFFSIMEQFDALLAQTIDSTLGLRCTMFGYQYSEILRSLMCVYLCGGSCIEDVTTHLMKHLSLHPTEINGIEFELNSILVEKWKGKPYRLVIQRQKRTEGALDIWEGEYTYRCILTNDYKSSARDIVEFYNLRGGKERIFDEMNNDFGWNRLPKSFMAQNTVFLLMTALIRNFYKDIMQRLRTHEFGLRATSRIKTFVFKFISVPAKWIKTSRRHVLNIYSDNYAYANLFKTDFG